MPRLLSVNVGLPRDVQWNGRTVHTGIWKDPVPGRCWVGRLNLHGDGQGDRALVTFGVALERLHVEIFNGGEAMTPGVVRAATRAPHRPTDDADNGPLVSFARSGIAAHWGAPNYRNILELAEACDVSVRWSCRTGVCHSCEIGLISGAVAYEPEPLDKPADGNLLVCCSRPLCDVVIDL